MTQTRTDIATRLRSAIASWKAEVAAAQSSLALQIAGTSDQLRRLIDVLSQRAHQDLSLAEAQDKIERLRAALDAADLPPGVVTRYAADTAPRVDAARQDLAATFGRLEISVGLWRAEVTQAQQALESQIHLANKQFESLLAMLESAAQEPMPEHIEAPLEALLRRNQNIIRALRQDKAELSARIQELHAALDNASEDAAAQARTLEYLQSDLDESRERCAELTEQRDYGIRRMQELERTTANLRAELENTRENNADTARQIEAQTTRLRLLEESVAAMEEASAIAAAQRQKIQQEHDALFQERDALRRALNKTEEEAARFRTMHEQEIATAQEQGQRLAETQNALAAQTAALQARDNSIAALQSRIAALDTEAQNLRITASDAQTLAREMREALHALQQAEEDREGVVTEYRAELRDLADQLAAEKIRADGLETHRVELAALLEKLQEKEAGVATVMDALQKENDASKEQSDAHARRCQEMRDALAAQSATLAERSALIQRMEDEIALLRNALTELQEQARTARIPMGIADDIHASNGHDAASQRIRQRILIAEAGQGGGRRPLGEILLRADLITDKQLQDALKEQRRTPDQLLGAILTRREAASEDAVAQAIACQLGIPLIHPAAGIIEKAAAALLNRDLCTWRVCIPLRATANNIVVAMANPLDESTLKKIQDTARRKVIPMVASPASILAAIDDLYGAF